MKAVVAALNQENALVGAFSVITNLRMELFQALVRGSAAAARPADQSPDVQLVDAGDPGHGGDQLGLDSGQQSEGRRDGTELQTKVPEDYAKFHNHGEGPY